MQAFDPRPRLVVVALRDELPVGTSFGRREWPAHVTIAGNFAVDEPRQTVQRAIREAGRRAGELIIRFAGEAMFGPNAEVPVQVVESEQVVALHGLLASALERMDGFVAEMPAHWRDGYRPHMTHTAGAVIREGAGESLNYMAIAEVTRGAATIIDAFVLSRESSP